MRILLRAAILAAVLVVAPAMIFPPDSGAKETLLAESDSGTTVRMKVGDVLVIELVGTPTTGYWWHFDETYKKNLELIEKSIQPPAGDEGEGRPAMGIWKFKAVRAGSTNLRARYFRSWEDPDTAVSQFEVSILTKAVSAP